VDGIQSTLKSEYNDHKMSAQTAIDTIAGHKNGLSEEQFKPLVSGAKNWCTAWKKQQGTLGDLGKKEKAMKKKKVATIPSHQEWQKACEWGVDEGNPGTTYSSKTFAATNAFNTEFNTARKAYWEAVKSHFEQNEEHKKDYTASNNEAAAFKASIDALANFEVAACDKRDRAGQKDIVDGFNSSNKKRAAVYRSLEVVLCHITHLNSATVKSSTDTCIATIKDEKHYQNTLFPDLIVPSIKCPTKTEVLKLIKDKYQKLDFHFVGTTTGGGSGSDGKLKPNQGWVPSTESCKKVGEHKIKGSTCENHQAECPTGKVYNAAAKSVLTTKGQVAEKCCRDKTCADFPCPQGKTQKSGVDAVKAPDADKCCKSSASFGGNPKQSKAIANTHSTDTPQWKAMAGLGDGSKFYSISVGHAKANTPYYGGYDGYLWESTDKGNTWTKNTKLRELTAKTTMPKGQEKHEQYFNSIAHSSDGKKVAVCNIGHCFLSKDSGNSWKVLPTVVGKGGHSLDDVKMSSDGSVIYVKSYHLKLWVSKDGGTSFSQLPAIPHQFPNKLTCISSDGKIVTVLGTHGSGFFVSEDYGATWHNRRPEAYINGQKANSVPDKQKFDAACSADGKRMVVVGGWSPGKVFTTKNSGLTWTLGTSNLWNDQCRKVAFCGSNKDYLVAGTYADKKVGLAVSKDFGGTWKAIPNTYSNIWTGMACTDDASLMLASVNIKYEGLKNPIVKTNDHYGFLYKVEF